jgi:hypothetical protein
MFLFKRERAAPKRSFHAAPTASLTPTASGEIHNDYAKYGLNSPPQGDNAVVLKEAEKCIIKKDGFGKYLRKKKYDDRAKMFIFLYGRGFMTDSSKKKREEKILDIMKSPKASEILLRVIDADGDREM